MHTRNYAHTNRVNVSINVRQTKYESVGLQYDSNHFRTDRFFDAIDNLSNNDNYFSTTVLLPSFSFLTIPQPAWIFNIDKSPLSPPQSPSPGIHLSSGRFTKDISSLVNQKIRRSIKFLSANRADRIVLLIFTAAFSHPPVGNVNIESRKSRLQLV